MDTHLNERTSVPIPHSALLPFASVEGEGAKLVRLPLKSIDPDPTQPRKTLGDLTDLALSIRQHGLLNPIIVEATAAGRYRILAGERRYSAFQHLGMESIDCLVRSVEEQSRMALQLIENMHRKDLSPVEEAQGLKRLMDDFNLTQRDLAQQVGKSVASVNQTLRVLDLEPSLLAEVQTSENLSKSVLLEIAKEADPQRQRELWEQAKAGQLSVREARNRKPISKKRPSATITLSNATVVVRFSSGEVSAQRMAEALSAAATKITAPDRPSSDV